ncbi:hypothetical protein BDN72DRAFT_850891 [Pluteus cervinus]|uniref:Uncharacterized protein n=1 Tax=Pluteus cervinus TaxID=181527 RepID=A0ACD3A437_9AGAR|nr:hypothetical protein BDN72DRAFT_850891 [Pluteus cervinus]
MLAVQRAAQLNRFSPLLLTGTARLSTSSLPSSLGFSLPSGLQLPKSKSFGHRRFSTGRSMTRRNVNQRTNPAWPLGNIRSMALSSSSPSELVWITELKTGSEPTTYKGTPPLGTPKDAQHVLLAGREYKEPKTEDEKARVAGLVKQDGTVYPPIDVVAVEVTFLHEQGSVCLGLDGLKPRGLVVECGVLEEYTFGDLEKLKTRWPLEHLWISGCIDPIQPIYESVTSLGLYYCAGVTFTPSWPFKALRELMIAENDAASMFVGIALNSLKNPGALKVLRLSSGAYDWTKAYEPCDFVEALKACPAIETLEIKTETIFDGVGEDGREHVFVTSLPQSLQHLRFRGPPEMIEYLPDWIRLASDPHWLPNLQTITFRLDADIPTDEVPDLPAPLPAVEEFLITLKQSHPSVNIDQSWKAVSPM